MASERSVTRNNKLIIEGAKRIALWNPTMGDTTRAVAWNGSAFTLGSSSTVVARPNAALKAEIVAAFKSFVPGRIDYKSGGQVADAIAAGEIQTGEYEFSHVENDAVGMYAKSIAGSDPIEVWFGKSDLA